MQERPERGLGAQQRAERLMQSEALAVRMAPTVPSCARTWSRLEWASLEGHLPSRTPTW